LCYGRWDDHNHRLTDLGSILDSKNRPTSTPKITTPDSPIKSLLMQSKHIIGATATSSPADEVKGAEIDESFKAATEALSDNEEPLDEHTKQNTPEMKRKGLTEKIKENVKITINKFSSNTDEQTKQDETIKIGGIHNPHSRPSYHDEIDGQAKYWIGKDYTNFILRDFTDLNQPFDDLIDRTKSPRMPWHDIASVVVGK
jgi:phospholipase D1/2